MRGDPVAARATPEADWSPAAWMRFDEAIRMSEGPPGPDLPAAEGDGDVLIVAPRPPVVNGETGW